MELARVKVTVSAATENDGNLGRVQAAWSSEILTTTSVQSLLSVAQGQSQGGDGLGQEMLASSGIPGSV